MNYATQEGSLFSTNPPHEVHHQTPDYLRTLSIDGQLYDLGSPGGCRDFEGDLLDGRLDGVAGTPVAGVEIHGHVIRAGSQQYDLMNPADIARLQADNADGKVDGYNGAPVPNPGAGGPPPPPAENPPVRPPTPGAAPPGVTTTSGTIPGGITTGGTAAMDPDFKQWLDRTGVDISKLTDKDLSNLAAQKAAQDRMEAITLLSNLLRLEHEARTVVIGNMKA
jgi:hypothetical protein